eukprot:182482_1
MKLVGSMKFDLDMPEVYERYDLRSDEDYVPVQTFWECNSAHVEDQLEQVRTILKGAKETGNSTRALLCYGENEETLIYADRGVIADGDDGWDLLKVTMNAFHKPVRRPLSSVEWRWLPLGSTGGVAEKHPSVCPAVPCPISFGVDCPP